MKTDLASRPGAQPSEPTSEVVISLESALGDEDLFVAVFEGLPDDRRRSALIEGDFAARVLGFARDADQPQALFAVQRSLQRLIPELPGRIAQGRVQSTLSSYSEAALAEHALAHGKRRLAAQLVEEGGLTAETFIGHFGAGAAPLGRWLETGQISREACLTLATPQDATAWVREGSLSGATFLELFAARPDAGEAAEHLVGEGLVDAGACMRALRIDATRACAWALAGALPAETFVAAHGRDAPDAARQLFDAGLLSGQAWLDAKCLDENAMRSLVQDGALSATACLAQGPVPVALAHAWRREKRIGKKQCEANDVQAWTPDDVLPEAQALAATRYRDAATVLARAPLPGAPGCAQRLAYAERLLAAHVSARDQKPWAQRLLAVQAGLRHLLSPAPAAPTGTCAVCFEPAAAQGGLTKSPQCDHPASFCGTCYTTALRASDTGRCPYPGCSTALTPDDFLRVGLGGAAASPAARRIVNRHLATLAGWTSCHTPDCPGGAVLRVTEFRQVTCRPCGQTMVLSRFEPITAANRALVATLVRGAQAGGTTRECYHCGIPTHRFAGCSHVDCACGQSWNFDRGVDSSRIHSWDPNEQTYVPRRGLLLRCGLYPGQTPGATGVPVGDLLVRQARTAGIDNVYDEPLLRF